jgi:hypothetical protein
VNNRVRTTGLHNTKPKWVAMEAKIYICSTNNINMNKHSTRDMETRWLADWDHSHDRRNTIKISARICTEHKKLASTSLVDWQAGGCMVCSVCSHVVGSYADGWQILDRFKCRWQIVSWLGRLIECFNRFEAALIARDCLTTHWSNQPITVQILDLPVLTSSCSGDTLNTVTCVRFPWLWR